jgi:RNA polymerase sigma-70 factor (ECF subfamily)
VSVPLPSPPPPEPSFAALVAAHQAGVWRYLRFLGADPITADDLTQDTFVAVWGKPLVRFGHAGACAYLRRTARNLWLKSRARRAAPAVDSATAELAYEWFRRDDGGEATLAALRACLEVLTPAARRALDLRYVERLERTAIALRLELSEDGVKSLLQRSYARLRACIERRLRHA